MSSGASNSNTELMAVQADPATGVWPQLGKSYPSGCHTGLPFNKTSTCATPDHTLQGTPITFDPNDKTYPKAGAKNNQILTKINKKNGWVWGSGRYDKKTLRAWDINESGDVVGHPDWYGEAVAPFENLQACWDFCRGNVQANVNADLKKLKCNGFSAVAIAQRKGGIPPTPDSDYPDGTWLGCYFKSGYNPDGKVYLNGLDQKKGDDCSEAQEFAFCHVTTEAKKKKNKLSAGAIAGIVIGSVVGLGLIIGLIVYCCKKRKSGSSAGEDRENNAWE